MLYLVQSILTSMPLMVFATYMPTEVEGIKDTKSGYVLKRLLMCMLTKVEGIKGTKSGCVEKVADV